MDVMSWNYYTIMGEDKIVVFRAYADIPYLGKPWKEIRKDEKEYYAEHDPLYSLFIYSLNP
ncbi:MAG: hypothetical protein M3Q97_09490 [Bacteroidota bacterium]|nr:hypothetical protein [Bacteroidota bacterium]